MKRTRLTTILGTCAVILALLATGCREAPSEAPAPPTAAETLMEKPRVLTLATTWPTGAPVFTPAVEQFAAKVNAMSQERLQIDIDSANKHKAPFGVLDMVKAGQYDLGHTASYYWKGKDPTTMFFTTMPFGMTAPEQYAWFYHGGGLELMQKIYARHGVYSFPGGNTGMQMGGWFREEINSLEDLQGLKMRIPGFAGEVLAELGVVVTNIAPGELYTSLERGTIDALEWVGPSLDLKMGFQDIAPYYYTGWHEPAAELQFLVNQQVFDGLPSHFREILVTSMQAVTLDTYAKFYHANAEQLARLQLEYPEVRLRTFPPSIIQAMQAANHKLLQQTAAERPLFREVLASQQAYLATVRPWTLLSDFTYLEAVRPDEAEPVAD